MILRKILKGTLKAMRVGVAADEAGEVKNHSRRPEL